MSTNKQQREAARRHLERQLERRQQREQARKRFVLITSVIGTVVVVAIAATFLYFVTREDKKDTGSTSAGACDYQTGSQSAAKPAKKPSADQPSTGTVTATIKTNQGDITADLDRASAHCTVGSFVSLAQQQYFDKTPCHRLTSGTLNVLQCGDPTGSGTGGPGYTFKDELTGSEKYTAGTLAMANSGANTNGSQFFIVYKDSQLPANYTIFGKVTKGLDVVTKVAAAGSTPAGDGKPKESVEIQSVAVGADNNATTAPTSSAPAGPSVIGAVKVANPTDLKKAPGATSTSATAASKLEIKDLVVGSGAAANPKSKVSVQYQGVLLSNGTEFDSSWARGGTPAEFSLEGVVPGFTQGIGGTTGVTPMKVGGRRVIVVPAALGYGEQANGKIPANSSLVFVVDLTKVS